MEGEGTLSRAQGPAGDAHQAREAAHTRAGPGTGGKPALSGAGRALRRGGARCFCSVCSFSLSFAINDTYDTLDPGGQHDDSIFVYTVT